jgi:hypothetical protein
VRGHDLPALGENVVSTGEIIGGVVIGIVIFFIIVFADGGPKNR